MYMCGDKVTDNSGKHTYVHINARTFVPLEWMNLPNLSWAEKPVKRGRGKK